MQGLKSAILAIFRQGRDGRALLVRPSRIPHRISKILSASGADDLLAMLEGKIREGPFFLRFNLVKKQCERSVLIYYCVLMNQSLRFV